MRPRVKVCGILTKEDALYCAHAGADALGFIFSRKSPRYISPAQAAKIIQQLPSFVTPVGVFVNEQRETIEEIIIQTRIRIIQMSGDETLDQCKGFPTKVWKAFRIRRTEDITHIRDYTISAALLDGAINTTYGGSGTLADFSVAREMKKFHPLVLAGGLSPDNVLEAVDAVEPYAIDVNSGVEHEPGKKDHGKVRLLFEKLGQRIH